MKLRKKQDEKNNIIYTLFNFNSSSINHRNSFNFNNMSITTSRAICRTWAKLPDTFFFTELLNEVRRLTNRPKRFDKTIYNELQRMKIKYPKLYGYTCIDKKKSIYKKNN